MIAPNIHVPLGRWLRVVHTSLKLFIGIAARVEVVRLSGFDSLSDRVNYIDFKEGLGVNTVKRLYK
jgi:hypothetical protein